ncbi:hypothetical protein VaNZ11_017033 [Volvox africanus]|uniref:Uncharacterized protein n=1 Tax=Volvox africanus TaxID=51714 RepID=A0ABQ5SNZ1_9CHLO|nr:hypothetical protein VaNZ11_017033 [Volvox africanus]
MYETQGAGGLLGLEPVRTAAATGPCGLASSSQQCCSRKSTYVQANHHQGSLAPSIGSASAPPCFLRPASSCLQRQSQHQLLHDAPMSPRRNDLSAGSPLPLTRCTGSGALAMAAVRPIPSVLKVLLPGSSGDLDEDVSAGDGFCSGLPSMVPDDQSWVQHSSSSARIRKALGSAQASLEQLPLHASSSLGGLRRQDSGTETAPPSGVRRPRELSLLPSTPSSSIGRGLRSCSVITSPQAPYTLAPQPPQSPSHPYHSGMLAPDSIVAPAARLSGAESPLKSSYKTQMQRLHVAGRALGGVDICDSEGEEGVQEAVGTVPEDEEPQVDVADGLFRMLRGQSSKGLEEMVPSRRGAQAWGPLGESAPGSSGSSDVLGCRGSEPPSAASKPSPGSAIGFVRRPEDLTAAPCPEQSRSLAGGSSNSAPCTAGSHGLVGISRMTLAWQPSNPSSVGANSVGSSSVGFSRRLEDLPAAPSPSNSRSLAGGAGSSGGDTPVSPVMGMATTSTVPRAAQQLLTTSPLPPQPKSLHGVTPAAGIAANIGISTSIPIAQQQQLPLRPAVRAAAAVYGEAALHQPHPSSNVSSTTTITITSSARHGATPSSAASAAQPPVAPKPPLQRQSSVGFSRRLEDLPAAPSPSNSRSLAGGAGSSASSTTSWCSQRTPPSPAASEAAMRSSMRRRVDDLPPAPPPSQSRSLRPDSSRALLRSHAGAAAGSNTSAGGPYSTGSSQAPPSPLAWRPSNIGGGGGGLLASLGSPPPQPPSCVINGSNSSSSSSGVGFGGGHMQQQMGPQPGIHDMIDLGGVCEDLAN